VSVCKLEVQAEKQTDLQLKYPATFFLNLKKISGSAFTLNVPNIIATKIRSAVLEGLIAYLGKDFNRIHRDAMVYPPYCISKTNCDTLY